MTCPDCTAAATRYWHGQTPRCRGCEVRALGMGLPYFESYTSRVMTPEYIAGLQKVFGDEWEQGHSDVKAEKKRIDNLEKRC